VTDGNCDLTWDESATLLRSQPVGEHDEDATLLHSAPVKPIPAPHRTPEEAEDTASAELPPLRLDLGQLGA